jgi:hypothetical protein
VIDGLDDKDDVDVEDKADVEDDRDECIGRYSYPA